MGKKAMQAFMKVDSLRKIGANALSTLLNGSVAFFTEHGLTLTGDDDSFPFDDLAYVLVSERESLPQELADNLYLISEMADSPGMDMTLDYAKSNKLISPHEEDRITPAEVAVRVFMHDSAYLVSQHDKRTVLNKRSFNVMKSRLSKSSMKAIDRVKVVHTEAQFSDGFKENSRSKVARIKHFEDDSFIRFLVAHGHTVSRLGIIRHEDESTASLFFRAQKSDGIIFDIEKGLLGLPNTPIWQREMYRKGFGLLIFGNRDAFESVDIFSLNPLIERGAAALDCPMLPKVESIRLCKVEWKVKDDNLDLLTVSGNNAIPAMQKVHANFTDVKISRARFSFKISGVKKVRFFEIHGSQHISATRDSDLELLWPWLDAQGFLVPIEESQSVLDEPELEDTVELQDMMNHTIPLPMEPNVLVPMAAQQGQTNVL